MKHTNVSNYIRENVEQFKQHILERKTEKELAKIYGCSNATIISLKKELKLQSRDLFKENKFNHKFNITHCKTCGNPSKKNTCHNCVQKRTRIAVKEILVELAGGKCINCGYSKCIAALDFHHLDPNKKEMNLNTAVSIERKIEELNKCILLCCRCHRELHYEQDTLDFVEQNRYNIDRAKERLFPSH